MEQNKEKDIDFEPINFINAETEAVLAKNHLDSINLRGSERITVYQKYQKDQATIDFLNNLSTYILELKDWLKELKNAFEGWSNILGIDYIKNITDPLGFFDENVTNSMLVMSNFFQNVFPQETLEFKEIYSDGKATEDFCYFHYGEFDPSIPINYWHSHGNKLNSEDFVYPKDEATGKSLGAWPKNYKQIPTSLQTPKTYKDNFIWPTTPAKGKYIFGYEHNGIDIATDFGTPVYAPVDGVITYSTFGDTQNRSTNETAYTITIEMNEALDVDGKIVDEVYLTHLSGIRYRCEPGEKSVEVKKGDLIGFAGTAQGGGGINNTSVPDWAPHLHMSIYKDENYDGGIQTSGIEKLYETKSGDKKKAGS